MDPLIDQLCQPAATSTPQVQLVKSRGQSTDILAKARAVSYEKYKGGCTVIVSRATVENLRRLFGPKLKARHLREFLDDLATGQYKITRVKPKPAPVIQLMPSATTPGPVWSLKQAAVELGVTYPCLLYRVQHGLIASIAKGKRRLIANDEMLRLKRVGLR
ncbi:MAG: hypothetical protein HQL97_10695 [Magnetococcales bacterium]|nr:hypothetical protein [Magnetococcales bacterium]